METDMIFSEKERKYKSHSKPTLSKPTQTAHQQCGSIYSYQPTLSSDSGPCQQ